MKKKLIHALQARSRSHAALPAARKQHLRSELVAYMDMHPALAPLPVPTYPELAWLGMLRGRATLGAALAVLLLAGGTGIARASESALPGEPLYVIKTKVSEPLAEALTTSPRAHAELSIALASRRIAEAASLSEKGKLTPEAQAALSASFSAHLDASTKDADLLEQRGDTTGSLQVRSELSAAGGGEVSDARHFLALVEDRSTRLGARNAHLDGELAVDMGTGSGGHAAETQKQTGYATLAARTAPTKGLVESAGVSAELRAPAVLHAALLAATTSTTTATTTPKAKPAPRFPFFFFQKHSETGVEGDVQGSR